MNDPVARLVASLPAETLECIRRAPTATVRAASSTVIAATSPAVARPADEPARELEPLGMLGEGGIGRVQLARQHSLQRDVAIKTVRPDRRSETTEASLLAEALFTGALEHPNIVPIHALVVDDEHGPMLVMKRVEGRAWRELIDEQPPVGEALDRHLETLMQVCNAAHFAHTRGIVHRDIKPDNVMVGEFGEVYLVDWGLALRLEEHSRPTDLVGTPAYMAPEMLQGGTAITPRTDVYLLGAVLYDLLAGRPPHSGDDASAILWSVSVAEPEAIGGDAPAPLVDVCARAMRRDPEERHGSALELRESISAYLRLRASLRLTQDAIERLEAARRATDVATRRRELVECEHGLRGALRVGSGNVEAAKALDECIADTIALELGEKNLGAARRLLEQMREPPPALREDVDALAEQLAREQAERRRIEQRERDRDMGISRRARVGFALFVLVANFGSAVWATTMVARGELVVGPRELVQGAIEALVLLAIVVWIGRKAFFRNRINRQLTLTTIGLALVVTARRVAALWMSEPFEHAAVSEMFVIAAGCAVAAAVVLRWMLVPASLALGLAFASVVRPEVASYALPVVLCLPLVAMIWGKPS